MAASPSTVVTAGLGSWSTANLLLTFGFGSGASSAWSLVADQQRTWPSLITCVDGQVVEGGIVSDLIVGTDLPDSGVTPGVYNYASLIIDQYGRVISALGNSTPVGTSDLATLGLPRWTKASKIYSDFSDPGITKTLTLRAFATNETCLGLFIKSRIAFSGGGIVTLVLDVSDLLGNMPGHIAAYNAMAAVSSSNYATGTEVGSANTSWSEAVFTATNMSIRATCDVGHTLDQATAGAVDVWMLIGTLP